MAVAFVINFDNRMFFCFCKTASYVVKNAGKRYWNILGTFDENFNRYGGLIREAGAFSPTIEIPVINFNFHRCRVTYTVGTLYLASSFKLATKIGFW